MKALRLTAYKQLDYVDAPVPSVAAGELLVRVKACGICGSDVHGYDGSTGRRIPPLVMGHEAAGVVEAAGEGVTDFSPGDRVTFDSTVYCGDCFFCRRGQSNLCDHRRVLGVSCGDYRRDGALAEFVVVPARVAFALPAGLSFQHAATVEAVSVAVHAVKRASPGLGDTALVVGAGMIGQLLVQAARAAGCGRVVVSDVDANRLAMAKAHGADVALDARQDDVPQRVRDLTDGRGADVVFEAVGSDAAVTSAIAAARKGGVVTLVGNVSKTVTLPLQGVVTREITLLGSCASAGEYPACLEMMARGTIDVSKLISVVAPLGEGAAWFDKLHRPGASGLLKVILTPGETR
jgi:L-iditol 2-dehydrogenase